MTPTTIRIRRTARSVAAGAFVLAWGCLYAWSQGGRYPARSVSARARTVHAVRTGIYVFGLAAWSLAVASPR